jgi:hypothetical protein
MIETYSAPMGQNMTLPKKKDFTSAELGTQCMLLSSSFRLVESKFRASDRNLTIRLRNHERTNP